MSLFSFQFLIPVLILVSCFFFIPGSFLRRWAFFLCNLAFIWLCLPGPEARIITALFILSGYTVARILRKKSSAAVLVSYLVLLVAAFLVLKRYDVIQVVVPVWIWDHPVATVGLSYMLFRQIHFLVDVMQGQIERFSLFSYLNYQLNLFGLLSGPIQRYQEFQDSWWKWEPVLMTKHDVLLAFLRIFLGIAKIGLSTKVLTVFNIQKTWFMQPGLPSSRAGAFMKFAVLFYSYPVYLYLNFSGYCDVVIAAAALIGIKLPENFERPYLSRNILDYWTRFHRTLSFWIRDYLFNPMYKALATRWDERAAILVFPCYFFVFVLVGAWHGPTLNFLVFGGLHGCGASANKAWEYLLVKQRGRKGFKQYMASRAVEFAAVFVTINFVCFTMLFFPNSVSSAMAILATFIHRMAH